MYFLSSLIVPIVIIVSIVSIISTVLIISIVSILIIVKMVIVSIMSIEFFNRSDLFQCTDYFISRWWYICFCSSSFSLSRAAEIVVKVRSQQFGWCFGLEFHSY